MINIEKEQDNPKEELISKKELLGLTKISYGQLYRWKRMNIIPEEWFIKKSSPTGQETFFKKQKILERIQMILSMKDNTSLEDIAALFDEKETVKSVESNEVVTKGLVSKTAMDTFTSLYGEKNQLEKKDLVLLSIIEKYLLKSMITIDEIKLIASMMETAFMKVYGDEGKLMLYRKIGVPFIIGCKQEEDLIVDAQAVKIMEVNLLKEASNMSRGLMA